MFKCNKCTKTFTRKDALIRHQQSKQNINACSVCGLTFNRKDNLNKHFRLKHPVCEEQLAVIVPKLSDQEQQEAMNAPRAAKVARRMEIVECVCDLCNIKFDTNAKYVSHLKTKEHIECEGRNCTDANVQLIKSAFKNRVASYRISAKPDDVMDIKTFLQNNKNECVDLMNNEVIKLNSCKINQELFAYYVKQNHIKTATTENNEDEDIIDLKSFNTKFKIIITTTNLQEVYDEFAERLLKKSEEFQERDSGWALYAVSHLIVNINHYQPMRGGTYIELPKEIADKHACVNIQNNDNFCIAWCILAATHPIKNNSHRIQNYIQYFDEINLDNISLPCRINDIPIVESNNNISINVYGLRLEHKSNKYFVEGPLHYTKKQTTMSC